MIRIKRMNNVNAATKFTMVAGKSPVVVELDHVCDLNDEWEQRVLSTGLFELATDAQAAAASHVWTQEEVDAAALIEAELSKIHRTTNTPMAKAREKVIERYGGVDNVPQNLRDAMKIERPDPSAPGEEPLPRGAAPRRPQANANNKLSPEERAAVNAARGN